VQILEYLRTCQLLRRASAPWNESDSKITAVCENGVEKKIRQTRNEAPVDKKTMKGSKGGGREGNAVNIQTNKNKEQRGGR
jgi:hypothetical protein